MKSSHDHVMLESAVKKPGSQPEVTRRIGEIIDGEPGQSEYTERNGPQVVGLVAHGGGVKLQNLTSRNLRLIPGFTLQA